MRHLFVRVRLAEAPPHPVERSSLTLHALSLVDFLAARWEVATAVGEVPLGRDPVVVERPVVVLEQCHGDLRAVSGADDRLVGLLSEPAGCVEAVDAGGAAFVRSTNVFPRSTIPTPSASAIYPISFFVAVTTEAV
jgi:hypothetical protein